jgi:hypothetical protein
LPVAYIRYEWLTCSHDRQSQALRESAPRIEARVLGELEEQWPLGDLSQRVTQLLERAADGHDTPTLVRRTGEEGTRRRGKSARDVSCDYNSTATNYRGTGKVMPLSLKPTMILHLYADIVPSPWYHTTRDAHVCGIYGRGSINVQYKPLCPVHTEIAAEVPETARHPHVLVIT